MKPLVKVILTLIDLLKTRRVTCTKYTIIALYVDIYLDKMDFYKFNFGQGLVLYYQLQVQVAVKIS